MHLVILVVIYQLSPLQSATLRSLSKSGKSLSALGHRIIIRDNSSSPFGEKEQEELQQILSELNYQYWHDGENKSLSQIYNHVIRKEISHTDYLLLLDHDTDFDGGFITSFLKAHNQSPSCSLFLPIIRQDKAIISPSNVFRFKGSYWKKARLGLIPSHRHTAINSGMIISGRYLLDKFEGYDEKLKFYNTDNFFMWKYAQKESHFHVLDYSIHHTLNFYDPDECFEKKKSRYQEMRSSALYLARLQSPLFALLTYFYYDIFSIKCSLLYKEPRFLFLR